MVSVSILLIFLVFFILIIAQEQKANAGELSGIDAARVCEIVGTEVNTAVAVGEGYSREFFLPEYVYPSSNYSIQIIGERVWVDWGNGFCNYPILSSNVTGNFSTGVNLIRNTGQAVVVN